METVNCNLCGSAIETLIYQIPDFLLDRAAIQTTLVQCENCGLIYQNPRPTLDEMGLHYPPEYESYTPPSGKNTSHLLQMAYDYGQSKRARVVTRMKTKGHLLDLGCATGTFLLSMKKKPGWQVSGVEISDHAAGIARGEHGLDVFTGTLEEAHFPEDTFDVVTMWDVFEHLHNPAASLREIHRVLKPGGLLILRVPNVDSWDAKLFGESWAGLDAPRHLYVFGRQTLQLMLEQNHFRVARFSCEIGSYPTFVLSVRFWMLQRGWRPETRERVVNWLYHPVMRLLVGPFFYLYGLGLRGPLLTAAAIKR
jgi:SAM-dependent methyltransferase